MGSFVGRARLLLLCLLGVTSVQHALASGETPTVATPAPRMYRIPAKTGITQYEITPTGRVFIEGTPGKWSGLGSPPKGAERLVFATHPDGSQRVYAWGKESSGFFSYDASSRSWDALLGYSSDLKDVAVGVDKNGKTHLVRLYSEEEGRVNVWLNSKDHRGASPMDGMPHMDSIITAGHDEKTGDPVFLGKSIDGRSFEFRSTADSRTWKSVASGKLAGLSKVEKAEPAAGAGNTKCVYAYYEADAKGKEPGWFKTFAQNRLQEVANERKARPKGVIAWAGKRQNPPSLEPIQTSPECTEIYIIYSGHSSTSHPYSDYVRRVRELYPHYKKLTVEDTGCSGMANASTRQTQLNSLGVRPEPGQSHEFWGNQLCSGPLDASDYRKCYFSWYGLSVSGDGSQQELLSSCHSNNPCSRDVHVGASFYCRNAQNRRVLYQCYRRVDALFLGIEQTRYGWEENRTAPPNAIFQPIARDFGPQTCPINPRANHRELEQSARHDQSYGNGTNHF